MGIRPFCDKFSKGSAIRRSWRRAHMGNVFSKGHFLDKICAVVFVGDKTVWVVGDKTVLDKSARSGLYSELP